MSEKLYAFLLRLYPAHFRREYCDDALRLVRDRARDEKGFLSGVRLWLDLLLDLVKSLPREYTRAPDRRLVPAKAVNSGPSFQLLPDRSANPVLLFLSGVISAMLVWACVNSVGHSRIFPGSFHDPHSLQWLVQNDFDLARSSSDSYAISASEYSFCVTAHRNVPNNSAQPPFAFHFAPPGASGTAFLDGKPIATFANKQHLSIRADLPAGDHQVVLHLDKPVENTSISFNDNLEYCQPK